MTEEIVKTEEPSKKGFPRCEVESVEKTEAPTGTTGDNWHRYTIGTGPSKIEGMKQGSLKAVTEYAQTIADDFNDRSGSRAFSIYSPKAKPKPVPTTT